MNPECKTSQGVGSCNKAASLRPNIEFVKMHGIGNDYVYLFDNSGNLPDDLPTLSIAISNRHCGVGGDGLVVMSRSERDDADFRMRIFNADGSEAQMCGNASRCVGKYLYERGYTQSTSIRLETLAGVKVLHLHVVDGYVESVTVDMEAPIFEPDKMPANGAEPTTSPFMQCVKVVIDGKERSYNLVSMGNPHAVTFVDCLPDDALVLGVGPEVERHPLWPERTNVEFAKVIDTHLIEMRVWERGSGETMACGTGACATAVAAMSLGLCESPVTVRLLGGDLKIEWERPSGHVFMTGGATIVAEGIYRYVSERDNIWMHPRQ